MVLVALTSGCGSRTSAGEVLAARAERETVFAPEQRPAPPPVKAPHAAVSSASAASAEALPSATAVPPEREAAPPQRETAAKTGLRQAPAPTAKPSCDPVNLGQVGTFSGVVGAITASARTAAAVWAKDVNARGGLGCHPVRLYAKDDGGDPARAAAAVRGLIEQQRVAAFVGSIVTFSVAGFRPAVESAGVPAVGGDTVAPEWHESPLMYSQGPGTEDQLVLGVRASVLEGRGKIGILYCVEVATCAYATKFLRDGGAKAGGGELVFDEPISITQPDFTASCLNARKAGVETLILGMDGSSMTRLARSCATVGYRPLLLTGAATFTLKTTEDPNLRRFGMVTISPVAPWMATDTPGLRAFHRALDAYAPDLAPDGSAVIGWSSGKLLEAAVARLTARERASALTAEAIRAGLGRLRDETLDGLTTRLSFDPAVGHGVSSGCAYLVRLDESGWTAPRGSKPICR